MKKRRFDYDFVRFAAMCMVVLFHFGSGCGMWQIRSGLAFTGLGVNLTLGQAGVVLFFIMSGITNGMSMQSTLKKNSFPKAVGSFYKKRFCALFPAFYTVYLFSFFILSRISIREFFVARRLWSLFGLDGFLMVAGVDTCYAVGEWFLGMLVLIYLIFPFLYYGISKKPILMASVITVIYAVFLILRPEYRPLDTNLFVRLFDFSLGIYIGRYMSGRVTWKHGIAGAAGTLVLLLIPLPKVLYCLWISLFGVSALMLLLWLGSLLEKLPGYTAEQVRGIIGKSSDYCFEVFLVHHIVILEILSKYFAGGDLGYVVSLRAIVMILALIVFWSIVLRKWTGWLTHVSGLLRAKLKRGEKNA